MAGQEIIKRVRIIIIKSYENMTPITLNVFEMFKYFEQYQKTVSFDLRLSILGTH